MVYTPPINFKAGKPLSASELNVVKENLRSIKFPPSEEVELASDFSTTSLTWVDVTGMEVTITSEGGIILIVFNGTTNSVGTLALNEFRFVLDGVPLPPSQKGIEASRPQQHMNVAYLNVPAGTYTVKLQAQTTLGTLTLSGGATYHTQLSAREIS